MVIFPNTNCYYLCVWMTDISEQRLTGPQITLTNIIKAAALANTSVTETQWNNFNNYAQWRNPFYLVYRDYQTVSTSSLNTGLQNFYKFEGNSNDSVGSLNGTDTNVTYSASFGKIGQGVRPTNTSSKIVIGGVSDFSFIQNTAVYSINFWLRLNSLSLYATIIGNTANLAQKGFYIELSNIDYTRFICANGSGGGPGSGYGLLSNLIPSTSYCMYTLCGDGSFHYLYVNNVLKFKIGIGALSSGNSTNALQLFFTPGYQGSGAVDLDLLGIWTKTLSMAERDQLYNSGAGLNYPF